MEREDCGITGCYAPKNTELQTEAGLPIAVCIYHQIKFMPENMRDDQAKELTGEDWKTVQEAYNKAQGDDSSQN